MKRCVKNRKNVGACSEFSGGYMPCPSGGGVTRKERKPIKYYILVGLTLRCRPVDTVFDRGGLIVRKYFLGYFQCMLCLFCTKYNSASSERFFRGGVT